RFGGYCSEIILPSLQVRKTPEHLSHEEAAAIPVVFMTAWIALCEMARVREGDRVLIQSAAGGVGTAAIQIAVNRGASVVGLTSSESKKDFIRSLGAEEAWNHGDWMKSSPKEKGGFDIILDSTGGKTL